MFRLRHSLLLSGRRATAAVEFALVCVPFVTFLLAVMSTGMNFFMQQALDYATQGASRQVQLGNVPANYTEADFVKNVFCPLFGSFQVCANVFVDLRPVTDYQQLTTPGIPDAPNSTATAGFQFCTGKPGQLMYVHIVYLAPSIGGALLGGNNAIVANGAFANENPAGTAAIQVNGC